MEFLYPHCAGLDVHKDTVVACVRHMSDGVVRREVRSFKTTTAELLALSEWLASEGCTHVVMEATGVYWKPVWHILSDGDFALTLANAAHVKNVPGRKTDVNDVDAYGGRAAVLRRAAESARARTGRQLLCPLWGRVGVHRPAAADRTHVYFVACRNNAHAVCAISNLYVRRVVPVVLRSRLSRLPARQGMEHKSGHAKVLPAL